VPAAGGVLVHDGTSVTLDRAMATDSAAIAATSKSDSNSISAFDVGNSVVVVAGDKTFTLADGAQTSLDHHVIVRNRPAGWSSSMELHWQRVLVYLSHAHPIVEAAVILETLPPHLGVRWTPPLQPIYRCEWLRF
jgi:hypothetical protein